MSKGSPPFESTNVGISSTNGENQYTFGETVAARVRILAEARRFNATSLGAAIGIPPSSAANYWIGKRTWPLEVLPAIADLFEIDVGALLRGSSGQALAVERLSDKRQEYRASGYRNDDLVEVAGIDLNFGLGPAFMDQEILEYQAERLHFPAAWLRQITTTPPEHLYWTTGVGNSMEPAIGDGDVILIDRSKVGSSFGDLYWAIAYGQTGMIKRLRPMPDGSVKILSDNQSVPPEIAYDGELHIFGRVVAVVRRI